MRPLSPLVALSLFASLLPAQDSRSPATVLCRGRDGRPWVDAKVHFVSRVVGPHHELEGADVLSARSDARGRVRVGLLPGRGYSVWAHGVPDEEGRYEASTIEEGVRAGGVARLRVLPQEYRQYTVRVTGLDAWRKHGPVRARVLSTATGNRWMLDAPIEGDTIVLPPSPAPWLHLQFVSQKEGIGAFWQEPVPVDAYTLEQARLFRAKLGWDEKTLARLEGGTEGKLYPIELAPPAEFTVRVVDLADAPIAGARVHRDPTQGRAPWHWVADTDDDGIARLVLPGFPGPGGNRLCPGVALFARAPKHADNVLLNKRLVENADPLKIQLADGHDPELEIRWDAETPLPAPQRVLAFCSIQRGKSGGQVGASPYLFRTGEGGKVRLAGRSARYASALVLLPGPALRRLLPSKKDIAAAPLLHLGSWEHSEEGGTKIHLAELVPLDIDVRRVDGRPERDAWVCLGTATHGDKEPHYPVRARLARDGRLRMFVPRGEKFVLWLCGPETQYVRVFETPKSSTPHDLVVTLPEQQIARGRVVDAKGEAVPFARVWLDDFLPKSEGSAKEVLGNWRTMHSLAINSWRAAQKGSSGGFANMSFRADFWSWHAAGLHVLRADRAGRFELALPPGAKCTVHSGPPRGLPFEEGEKRTFNASPPLAEELQLKLRQTP